MELGLSVTGTYNSLNQLIQRAAGTQLTAAGAANYAVGTVTVNGVVGTLYGDRTWARAGVNLGPGSNAITAVYRGPAFTNTAYIATTVVSVAHASPAAVGHDGNGNVTNDGTFAYQWDARDRLTGVVRRATGQTVLACRYDGLGRRVEAVRNGTNVERYVYLPGSWQVLALLDGTNGVKETYTHGPDLSGGLGGAGGIGGLLSVTFHQPAPIHHFLHADANGNVVLATTASGTVAGVYAYTPYGQTIARVGDFAPRYGFSSKEYDPESGLVYYGYRHYAPSQGRWLSRDPIGEMSLFGLYTANESDPLDSVDPDGRDTVHPGSPNVSLQRSTAQLRECSLDGNPHFMLPTSWRSHPKEGQSCACTNGANGLSERSLKLSLDWLRRITVTVRLSVRSCSSDLEWYISTCVRRHGPNTAGTESGVINKRNLSELRLPRGNYVVRVDYRYLDCASDCRYKLITDFMGDSVQSFPVHW